MNDKYERQLKKGVLDMLVLTLLKKEQKYGYQLISELAQKGGSHFQLKEGTLYPVLYRLEEEGLIESKWSQPEGKQLPRKYYVITERGIITCREIVQTWQEVVQGIKNIVEDVEDMNHEGDE